MQKAIESGIVPFVCLFAIIIFIVSSPVFSASVLKVGSDGRSIVVSHDNQNRWKVGGQLCVVRDEEEIACGQVIQATSKGVIIDLSYQIKEVNVGDSVARATPASKTDIVSPNSLQPLNRWEIMKKHRELMSKTAGRSEMDSLQNYENRFDLTVGTNLYFPMLNFQIAVSPRYTLSLMPGYFSAIVDGVNARLYGMAAALNYYGNEPFKGLWLQLGFGVYYTDILYNKELVKATSQMFIATAGWRWLLDGNMNIGLAVGIQYFRAKLVNTNVVPFNIGIITPAALIDIGIAF